MMMRVMKRWPWVVGGLTFLAAGGGALLAGRNGKTRRRYVSPSQIGLGYVKPNHYLEMAKVLPFDRIAGCPVGRCSP